MTKKKYLLPLIKDGAMMAVIRPADPKKALSLARRIQTDEAAGKINAEEAGRQFNAMLGAQRYTYVGIAAEDGVTILSREDLTPSEGETLEPGDSFADYDELRRAKQDAIAK